MTQKCSYYSTYKWASIQNKIKEQDIHIQIYSRLTCSLTLSCCLSSEYWSTNASTTAWSTKNPFVVEIVRGLLPAWYFRTRPKLPSIEIVVVPPDWKITELHPLITGFNQCSTIWHVVWHVVGYLAAWCCGYNVGSVNGVKQHWARLVLGWVTVQGIPRQRSTQP